MTDQQRRCQSAQEAVLERWRVPVERIELASEFGTTVVTACGPRDGEPLVLQHSGSTTSAVWFANAAELARTRRLYAVDRIGEAGFSRPGQRPLRTVEDLHTWLDGVLDGLSLTAPDLLAHSYGAGIAMSYALSRPRRVRRMALLDPTQVFAGFRIGYLLHALPMLARPSAARAQRFLAWETGGRELDPAWLELYGRAAEFPRAKFVIPPRPKAAQLAGCQTPTLVLLAAESRCHDARAVQAGAARLLPGAQTVLLPGVTHHGMPYQQAAELNRLVEEFLAKP
ncbi:alpha/beta fold hydrolase [Kitasatospora acidiphila]|uniref:Alpha/beta fold hydrolase n=1 Tax=Kitasatospora acidiphila TaxID=2567942 RepID=A0A540WD41_9ACTN|nr:alpha/beta fold hydrolase [Kitasatospora acidiphila]TQF06304.1 alpha/beta fold hydrolase [Kitasatospora acidiphila]